MGYHCYLHSASALPRHHSVIKTHGSESEGQGGSTSRQTHVNILQEQTLLN